MWIIADHFVDDFNGIDMDEVANRRPPLRWCRGSKRLQKFWPASRDDDLPPHTANRLAGRLNFITQSTFGALGKAALQPVYARAHDAAAAS